MPSKDALPPNFTKKTFANSNKTLKFTKVVSLKSFPVYGISNVDFNVIWCQLMLTSVSGSLLAVSYPSARSPSCVCWREYLRRRGEQRAITNLEHGCTTSLCAESLSVTKAATGLHNHTLVLEPDPQEIEKEGLVNWMGWKCTLHPVCRRTSDWLLINILMCIYWKC